MLNREIQALVKYIIIIYCWEWCISGECQRLRTVKPLFCTPQAQVAAVRSPASWHCREKSASTPAHTPSPPPPPVEFQPHLTNPQPRYVRLNFCWVKWWSEKLRGGVLLTPKIPHCALPTHPIQSLLILLSGRFGPGDHPYYPHWISLHLRLGTPTSQH